MKQTAVEFLAEKLEKLIPSGNQLSIRAILEQAKEMEKQDNKFKNSPIHSKKAIIEMMDELHPKEMTEVVDFIKLKLETFNK